MSRSKASSWVTKSLTRRSAQLTDHVQYQRALEQIERLPESGGFKHLLANYVTDLALEGRKIPEKLLSRRHTQAFGESVQKTMTEDRGLFEISGMISIICAVLVCMFVRAVMMDRYVVNFSVDALIAAVASAFLILNLRSQFLTLRFYGPLWEYALLDILAVLIWIGLTLLYPSFDTSLIIFVLVYFVEKAKFKRQREAFCKENGISFSPDPAKA